MLAVVAAKRWDNPTRSWLPPVAAAGREITAALLSFAFPRGAIHPFAKAAILAEYAVITKIPQLC
jgi:hypothetical protein